MILLLVIIEGRYEEGKTTEVNGVERNREGIILLFGSLVFKIRGVFFVCL